MKSNVSTSHNYFIFSLWQICNLVYFLLAAFYIWGTILFSFKLNSTLETLVSVKTQSSPPTVHTQPSTYPSVQPSFSQKQPPPRSPNPGYCSNLFFDIVNTVQVGPVSLHNLGGDFGQEEMSSFIHKISEQLRPVQSDGTLCNVYFRGDAHYKGKPQFGGKGCQKVWFVMNGEQSRSEVLHKASKRHMGKFFHDFIYVGNWWASWSENFTDNEVTSFWLPYVSTNFVSHEDFTPMDLFNRTPMFHEDRKVIVYQQRNCDEHRESYWDSINELLKQTLGVVGTSLSKCNGFKDLGERKNFTQVSENHFDDTIYSYSNFEFSLNMEHNSNDIGYITEKIADGFLASSLPIYRGAKQIEQIFLPGSFLSEWNAKTRMLTLLEEPEELRRLQTEPVISEAAMRRFFSWHPSVWPYFGDAMRADIWKAIAKHCHLTVDEIYR